jgi:hypothetical protein
LSRETPGTARGKRDMVTTDSSYIAVAQNASQTLSARPIMLRPDWWKECVAHAFKKRAAFTIV